MPLAVSACLLGEPCRYDGEARPCEAVRALREAGCELLPVCPEVLGGLAVPRLPSEIDDGRAGRARDGVRRFRRDRRLLGGRGENARAGAGGGLQAGRAEGEEPLVRQRGGVRRRVRGHARARLRPAARALREAGVRVVDEVQLQACLEASEARRPGQPAALLAATSAECPVLETERLVLRPLVPEDVDDVFAYCSNPDVGPDAGWPPHRTREDARVFVEIIASEPHVFGIFEKLSATGAKGRGYRSAASESTGPCIGSIGLIRDPQRRNVDCLMLGYALAQPAWGKGYMTEASNEVLRYGFEELGLAHGNVHALRVQRALATRHREVGLRARGHHPWGRGHARRHHAGLRAYYLTRERWTSTVGSLSTSLR